MPTTPTRIFLICSLLLALLGACSNTSSDSASRESGGSAPGSGDGLGTSSGAGASGGFSYDPESEPPFSGESSSGAGGTGGGLTGAIGGTGGGLPAAPADGDSSGAVAGAGGSGGSAPQSGSLTAGAWDDNRNFDRFRAYRSELLQDDLDGVLPTTDAEHAAAHEDFAEPHGARAKLDIALVIDTTGSMSDEISYLQTEFLAITRTIASQHGNAEQRWALVAYRDVGDAYVVRSTDFGADMEEVRSALGELFADGGGDFPEAPDAALAEANALDWRSGDDVARLVFWVADAPHHAENAEALADALREARGLDAHVYPVASSGVDELTELTMRSAAQLTGGRYLFLTSDSGIGGEHKEPTIPCYFVTRLDHAILRMVDIELSGEYREPEAEEIIRTGGDPQDGACTLEDGEELLAF